MRWIVEFDSHKEKKGDIFEGDELPLYLHGKVRNWQRAAIRRGSLKLTPPQKKASAKQNKGILPKDWA